MAKKDRSTAYTCERCGAPCAGITCDPCHAAVIDSLLSSPGWCAVAATRTGWLAGETLLDSYRRVYDAAAEVTP